MRGRGRQLLRRRLIQPGVLLDTACVRPKKLIVPFARAGPGLRILLVFIEDGGLEFQHGLVVLARRLDRERLVLWGVHVVVEIDPVCIIDDVLNSRTDLLLWEEWLVGCDGVDPVALREELRVTHSSLVVQVSLLWRRECVVWRRNRREVDGLVFAHDGLRGSVRVERRG